MRVRQFRPNKQPNLFVFPLWSAHFLSPCLRTFSSFSREWKGTAWISRCFFFLPPLPPSLSPSLPLSLSPSLPPYLPLSLTPSLSSPLLPILIFNFLSLSFNSSRFSSPVTFLNCQLCLVSPYLEMEPRLSDPTLNRPFWERLPLTPICPACRPCSTLEPEEEDEDIRHRLQTSSPGKSYILHSLCI